MDHVQLTYTSMESFTKDSSKKYLDSSHSKMTQSKNVNNKTVKNQQNKKTRWMLCDVTDNTLIQLAKMGYFSR